MKQINTGGIEPVREIFLEKLPDYIKGELPKHEEWRLEELMNQDLAFSDAVEGLKSIENPSELFTIHQAINSTISARLSKNKRKKMKQAPLFFPAWIVLLTGVLILIVIVGFIVIRLIK